MSPLAHADGRQCQSLFVDIDARIRSRVTFIGAVYLRCLLHPCVAMRKFQHH